MPIRHGRIKATALALLMIVSCLIFINDDAGTDTSADTPDVVVIYSTIDSDDSLNDIVSEQEKVYAEKQYYESSGSEVLLVGYDNFHSSDMDEKDKRLIDDILDFIGYTEKDIISGNTETSGTAYDENTDEGSYENHGTVLMNVYVDSSESENTTVAYASISEITIDENYESDITASENIDDLKIFIMNKVTEYYGIAYSAELSNLIEGYSSFSTVMECWNDPLNPKDNEPEEYEINGPEYSDDLELLEEYDDEMQEDVFEMPSNMQDIYMISHKIAQLDEDYTQFNILKAGIEF